MFMKSRLNVRKRLAAIFETLKVLVIFVIRLHLSFSARNHETCKVREFNNVFPSLFCLYDSFNLADVTFVSNVVPCWQVFDEAQPRNSDNRTEKWNRRSWNYHW